MYVGSRMVDVVSEFALSCDAVAAVPVLELEDVPVRSVLVVAAVVAPVVAVSVLVVPVVVVSVLVSGVAAVVVVSVVVPVVVAVVAAAVSSAAPTVVPVSVVMVCDSVTVIPSMLVVVITAGVS